MITYIVIAIIYILSWVGAYRIFQKVDEEGGSIENSSLLWLFAPVMNSLICFIWAAESISHMDEWADKSTNFFKKKTKNDDKIKT